MDKKAVIDAIIDTEGGYVNDPADSGGETNYGITVDVARDAGFAGPMRQLPRQVAFDIYSSRYWDAVQADAIVRISDLVAEEVG